MEFGILGPLEIRLDNGQQLYLPRPRYRAVLCLLLLHAGDLVPKQRLAADLWGSGMPSDPAGSLKSCLYFLRKALNSPQRLQTHNGGYAFVLQPGDVFDLHTFRDLRNSGMRAADCGDHYAAARLLQQALDLWRYPPLADFPDGDARLGTVPALLEQRACARETLIGSRLALGHNRDLVPWLIELTAADPFRERHWEQLMLALYESGQQAAALEAYAQARAILVEQSGIDPGPGLRTLHQRILAADPALGLKPGSSPAAVLSSPTAMPGADAEGVALTAASDRQTAGAIRVAMRQPDVPRELPGAAVPFIGRNNELTALHRFHERASAKRAAAAPVAVIGGTAGVGKTALAVHWASQMADSFLDGQLYLNLRGYDPGQPMSPSDALSRLLRSLGVPGQEIPTGVEERAARYRSLLSARQVLIILDNAREVGQVRPLLPGTPACQTVVTSRDMLAGLVARDGAYRLNLEMLPLAAAVGLLTELIGARAASDPGATRTLAEQCCRLPLALRVAAELALAQPAVPLADLVVELADQRRRLDLLDAVGDEETALRAVFSWSYRQLDDATARAFRLIGWHPGPQVDDYVCAALTDATVEQAGHILSVLARAYLLHPLGSGRYDMNELMRSYARELAAE